jgi:predicted phage terminase large subunit-like protein
MKPSIALKKAALHDIWDFADLIDFKGGAVNFDTFHFDMSTHYADALQQKHLAKLRDDPEIFIENKSTFVNIVSRGYLKSTVNTILYTLWRIYRNPNLRISINTNVQSLAYSFIRELRSYFEDVELIDNVWDSRPHIPGRLVPNLKVTKNSRGASSDDTDAQDSKVIWNNVALQVLRAVKCKEPTISIGSANSINTGNHYDLVIFDDVVDFDNSATQVKRIKLKRWVNEVESQLDPLQIIEVLGTTSPLLDAVGYKIINGTLYYDEDLYSQFIERSDLSDRISIHLRNIYKNGKDSSAGYNWSAKFSNAVLAEIKERIDDPVVFAAQYENRTLQQYREETNTAKQLVLTANTHAIGARGIEIVYEDQIYTVDLFAAMDVATKHDYSVLTIGAYLTPEIFCVVDALTNRGSLESFLKESYHYVQERYPIKMCFVEANGVGGGCKTALSLIHQQKHAGSFVPLKFTEIYQTESKAMRIAYALTYLTDNKVLVMGSVSNNSEFVKQIKNYPSEYDDVIDCLSTCLYRFPKNIVRKGRETYTPNAGKHRKTLEGKLRQIYNQGKTNTLRTRHNEIFY